MDHSQGYWSMQARIYEDGHWVVYCLRQPRGQRHSWMSSTLDGEGWLTGDAERDRQVLLDQVVSLLASVVADR